MQAVIIGVRRAFWPIGRASRTEFWWFFPVGLLLPAFGYFAIGKTYLQLMQPALALALLFFAFPLLTAAARRLQDSGENGGQVLMPFTAPIIFGLVWLTYRYGILGTFFLDMVSGFNGLISLTFFLVMTVIMIPVFLLTLVFSLISISHVLGCLMLPSQPGPNRYGPNPNEVTQ